ncbi:phage portal protein [Bacillus cereus]|uniref:phage portal protein n=2 Tax=Bacillus cereus TaxID=1396 RepID=UPI000C2857F1|nr:phage portal protein [Bacillus cereus]HDR4683575.1 phage portal protein [Bacillus cereus]HDR4687028.1 phage portal protein [Bacillus cereus]
MLTFKQARDLFFRFKTQRGKGKQKGFIDFQKLHDYYVGEHDIVNKKQRPNGRKTYRTVSNYPQYVSTISTGFFIGSPVTYTTPNKEQLEPALDIIDDNDGQTVDYDNALDMSIYGKAYRLFFHDEDGELNFKDLDPRYTIVVTDGKIKPKVTEVIYFSEALTADNTIKVTMTIYDSTHMREYEFNYKTIEADKTKADITEMIAPTSEGELEEHKITDEDGKPKVPVLVIPNNKFELGDYEPHLSLIDAYNDMDSNDFEDAADFTDAILKLVNMSETSPDDVNHLNEDKVLLLDEDGDADWLIKKVDSAFKKDMKERLENNIHKYTFVPNMNDTAFGGNLTGVAIKYKLLALEQVRGQKERMFHKALTDQLAIIKGYLAKFPKGAANFELKDVKLQFTPNLPPNFMEEAELVTKLRAAGLPDKFIYSYLSNVQDVEHLIEMKREEEQERYENEYSFGGQTDDLEKRGAKSTDQDRERNTPPANNKGEE